MEPFNQVDRLPDAEENPGSRYRQIPEGQARPRARFRYIHVKQEPSATTAGSVRVNSKEREVRRGKKKKGIEAERVKPYTSIRAVGALIGEEEPNIN